tara:strand:- start:10111 stop:10737 length:627 start_codon:yes stop_codon:yes gene_type:complete
VDRSQKEKAIADFKSIFEEAEAIIVAHYEGINADSINELRSKTRNSNVTFRVTKNRLVKIALENSPYKNLSEFFSGPTAITYSKDIVAAAKVTTSFAKENEKLIVIGGALKDKVLDLDAIKHLASLPSLLELQAKIIGLLSAPARQIATVLSTPSKQVVTVVKSYEGAKKDAPKEEATPKEEASKEEATPKEEASKEEAAPKEEAAKE